MVWLFPVSGYGLYVFFIQLSMFVVNLLVWQARSSSSTTLLIATDLPTQCSQSVGV